MTQTLKVLDGDFAKQSLSTPGFFILWPKRRPSPNWPGTRWQRCDPQEVGRYIQHPLSRRLRRAAALTGIPSRKPGDHSAYPQSLDRLLCGLQGYPFMYIVVAEPMSMGAVNDIIYQCRELAGRVHTLTKTTLTETLTRGVTKTEGQSSSTRDLHQETTEERQRQTRTKGLDIAPGKILSGLAPVFPPAAFLSALIPITGKAENKTETSASSATTEGTESSTGQSHTLGFSMSEMQAFGKEYINAHAQATKAQLDQYLARFEQARTLGCWNVGVYFLAEKAETAQQGAAQLRALLTGEKSAFEPMRAHNLARLWDRGPHSLKIALSDFEQPPLTLVDPETQVPLPHPLGQTFGALTTPLHTEELSLLVNLPHQGIPTVAVPPQSNAQIAELEARMAALGQRVDLLQAENQSLAQQLAALKRLTE